MAKACLRPAAPGPYRGGCCLSRQPDQSSTSALRYGRRLTFHLLLAVAGEGADDGILLPSDAVSCTLSEGLSRGSLVLGLTLGVLLLARLGPGAGVGEVADGLHDSREWY